MRLISILALTMSLLLSAQVPKALDPGVQSKITELLRQEDYQGVRALLEPMRKEGLESPDLLFQWGVLSLAEEKYPEAEAAFRRAYALNPGNTKPLMGIAETLTKAGRNDEALGLLQAESDKAPERLDLRTLLGNVEVRLGKFDLAIATFNKALAMTEPGRQQGDLYLRLGETNRRKGDTAAAIAALQKARETMPHNVVVLSTLGLVLDGAGRKVEAREIYEAVLKVEPNSAVVLNNLAFLLADTGGDLDSALTMAQRAKQLLPAMDESSDTLGLDLPKRNMVDNAIDIFKDLVAKHPSRSTFHFHLGIAYSQKGEREKALDELRMALKYSPTAPEKDHIKSIVARLEAR